MKNIDNKLQKIERRIKLYDVLSVVLLSVIIGLVGFLLSYSYALN